MLEQLFASAPNRCRKTKYFPHPDVPQDDLSHVLFPICALNRSAGFAAATVAAINGDEAHNEEDELDHGCLCGCTWGGAKVWGVE